MGFTLLRYVLVAYPGCGTNHELKGNNGKETQSYQSFNAYHFIVAVYITTEIVSKEMLIVFAQKLIVVYT
jgi:hypothetical protein